MTQDLMTKGFDDRRLRDLMTRDLTSEGLDDSGFDS